MPCKAKSSGERSFISSALTRSNALAAGLFPTTTYSNSLFTSSFFILLYDAEHIMAQNASPKFTPALTTSSHDTAMAADDPFLLQTPAKEDTSNTSAMSSFLFPSRSFEIEVCLFCYAKAIVLMYIRTQRFTNIKDVVPEWEDDDVDVSI